MQHAGQRAASYGAQSKLTACRQMRVLLLTNVWLFRACHNRLTRRTVLSACTTVYWAGSAALGAMAVTAPPNRGRKVRLLLPSCHMTCTSSASQYWFTVRDSCTSKYAFDPVICICTLRVMATVCSTSLQFRSDTCSDVRWIIVG